MLLGCLLILARSPDDACDRGTNVVSSISRSILRFRACSGDGHLIGGGRNLVRRFRPRVLVGNRLGRPARSLLVHGPVGKGAVIGGRPSV